MGLSRGLLTGVLSLVVSGWLIRCQKKTSKKIPEQDEPSGASVGAEQKNGVSATEHSEPNKPSGSILPDVSGSSGQTGQKPASISEAGPCQDDGRSVRLEAIPDGGEAYQVKLRIYGRADSCLLALQLAGYQKNEVSDIFISDHNGKLIAQRGISDTSDVTEEGFLKIVVFDHLRIMDGSSLVILFKTLDAEFFKTRIQSPVSFELSYRGLPVRGPGSPGFQDPEYYDRHPGNIFSPAEEQFSGEKDPSAILHAGYNTSFLYREDLAGTVITDLMGNVLSDHGEHFNLIKEDTMFIVYRLMRRKYWFRTFIRIS